MKHIHFVLTREDENYLSMFKMLLQGKVSGTVSYVQPVAIMEVVMDLKERNVKCVAFSSQHLLNMLLGYPKKSPTINNYAGSMFERGGVEFLVIPPLEWMVTKTMGKFLMERYLLKFIRPEYFLQLPEFKWELFSPANTDSIIDFMCTTDFIAVDIETGTAIDRVIKCCGFTGVQINKVTGCITLRTVVIPFTSDYNVAVASAILALPNAKATQNGKYDNAYLLRYGMPMANWAYDTAHLFHSWYSEMPKRLDFITSFLLRKWQYWKDEGTTYDLMEYYEYNGKDCYTTAMDWLALMAEIPEWAWNNYLAEFPLVFPCLLSELTGLKRDAVEMGKELIRFENKLDVRLKQIQGIVGKEFNPSSPQQCLRLLHVLGNKDLKDTTPPSMDKASHRHPFTKYILDEIIGYRKDRKLVTSYLRDEDTTKGRNNVGTKTWNGRIFYSLNPHGTDTSRLASKESAFWCGWQIQNIPRDREDIQIKSGIIADEGFYFGEADFSQAEARDTAYLSGDTALIKAVDDNTKDFHGSNASSFFGIPYEKIVKSYQSQETQEWLHSTIDKAIRDLAKRTNHGANYNMGAGVMLDTMGIKNVLRAKSLLGLPVNLSLLKVTEYLLDVYSKTYPTVKGPWYDKVKSDIASTNVLVGPTGWTRYCFGKPSSNKRDLNSYVAHPPQSLNAQILNKAYRKVFYNIWLPNQQDFRLHAQIHDSIFFAYRIGRQDLAYQVAREMNIPTPVKDTFGITRTLIVPVDLKGEAARWSELKTMRVPSYG